MAQEKKWKYFIENDINTVETFHMTNNLLLKYIQIKKNHRKDCIIFENTIHNMITA